MNWNNPEEVKEYHKKHNKKYHEDHKEEIILYQKEYRKNHEEELKLYLKRYTYHSKYIVLLYYSNYNIPKCACCGESTFEFLGLDHINCDGSIHKKSINKYGNNLYRFIIINNFPPELDSSLQVLCHNCNRSKGIKESCIHSRKINITQYIISPSVKCNRKRKHKCLVYYSGSEVPFCACCGETEPEFLGFDHINGGGRKHRKGIGAVIVDWIMKNNFPPGLRVLCLNCNQATSHNRICPHKLQKFI